MATVRTVALPDGSTFTMSDWGDYPLWSRAEMVATATQDTIIFNYVQSGQIPGGGSQANATLIDTNMPATGNLPLRHQMVIFSVMARYDEAMTWDGSAQYAGCVGQNVVGTQVGYQEPTFAMGLRKWNNIKTNMLFQLVVEGNKPYVEGSLDHFPAGGGLWTEATADAAITSVLQTSYYVNNGEPGAHAGRRLAMPIHLGALESFQGLLRLPRGALCNWTNTRGSSLTGYGITVVLNGPRQRPVG